MLKVYTGGCHCGALRFRAEIDFSDGTDKCNCSLCMKSRLWTVKVCPSVFRLLSGETALRDYRGQNPVAHHLFCRHCGVRPFQWVDVPNRTGEPYYNINIACLDNVDIDELMGAPVHYNDGLNDNWSEAPLETRHL